MAQQATAERGTRRALAATAPFVAVSIAPAGATAVGVACWSSGMAVWETATVAVVSANAMFAAVVLGLHSLPRARRVQTTTLSLPAQTHDHRPADPPFVPANFVFGLPSQRLGSREARMRKVIADRRLDIAMQPVIDLRSGAWVYAEALARFPDERSPDQWFAHANELGLGADLELLAIEAACAHAVQLPRHIKLAVNASPNLVLDRRLTETLIQSGIDLDRIILEVTEHDAVSDYSSIGSALSLLRRRGLCLAVDDAGAGYASFAHVLQLRPDIIKLDRAVTMRIDSDAASRALVTGVVLLAYELGARLVAEGVENVCELAVLDGLGVDCAQGFFFARPTVDVDIWRSWGTKVWDIRAAHRDPRVLADGVTPLRIANIARAVS